LSHRLREASIHVVAGHSVVAPLIVEGLPAEIDALGVRWQRKREFHLTVLSRAIVEAAAESSRLDAATVWDTVTRALSGRTVGPITTRNDLRRVNRPDNDNDNDDDALQTLIVMVDAPGLNPIYRELSAELATHLDPPPAHVTLYSTDPAEGIGIESERQLAERAPPLTDAEQQQLRDAISFDRVFPDDEPDPPFTPDFTSALEYAAHVHRGQRHRGRPVPYLAHLLAVATLVAEDGGGETEVVAALLHDAAEDRGGEPRLNDIERHFGPEVASIVRELSDSLDPGASPTESWRQRKRRYLGALRNETDPRILRVSNADKLHNARTLLAEHRLLGDTMWTGRERDKPDELWYYGALATIFTAKRPTSMLARELSETVALLAGS
jgi:hypothetical protein